jgi:hypothetical protein
MCRERGREWTERHGDRRHGRAHVSLHGDGPLSGPSASRGASVEGLHARAAGVLRTAVAAVRLTALADPLAAVRLPLVLRHSASGAGLLRHCSCTSVQNRAGNRLIRRSCASPCGRCRNPRCRVIGASAPCGAAHGGPSGAILGCHRPKMCASPHQAPAGRCTWRGAASNASHARESRSALGGDGWRPDVGRTHAITVAVRRKDVHSLSYPRRECGTPAA